MVYPEANPPCSRALGLYDGDKKLRSTTRSMSKATRKRFVVLEDIDPVFSGVLERHCDVVDG